MGKSKQAQRIKGNLQPSSSSKAAELLVSTQGIISSNIFVFPKSMKSENDEIDNVTDSDFSFVLKKLSKKDNNTKAKGLQEFGQLCLEKDFNIVASILPYWVPLYTKLSLDNDRRVRELTQECLGKLVGRVRKQLGPHLKNIMGVWLMVQCDVIAPCATLARKMFEEAFNESKRSEAIWFCRDEIFNNLKDNLFKLTIKSIKESNICDAEEVEGRYIRLLTSSLDAISRFFQLIDPQLRVQLPDKFASLLGNSKFWKFQKNESPNVRRAYFGLISTLCDKGYYELVIPYEEPMIRSVFLSLDETDPSVVPALWRAVVPVICNFQNCWLHVNMQKAFLPKLFSVLDKGGYGCAVITHPVLIIILDRLPRDIKMEDGFSSIFLSKIRAGFEQSNVLMSPRECDAIVSAFVECCKYSICNSIEKVEPPNIRAASTIIKDQILILLVSALTSPKNTLANSKFFPLLSELIYYVNKMSNRATSSYVDSEENNVISDAKPSHSLWRHVCKTFLDELSILLMNLLEEGYKTNAESLTRITKFFKVFLSYQSDVHCPEANDKSGSQDATSRKLRKGVSFDESVNRSHAKKCEDIKKVQNRKKIQKVYRDNEMFRDFVHDMSSALFKLINTPSACFSHVQLFRTFFEHFVCIDFIGALTIPQENLEGSGNEEVLNSLRVSEMPAEESRVLHFTKAVALPWLTSADLTLFPEIGNMFLSLLSLMPKEKQTLLFEFTIQELEKGTCANSKAKVSMFLSLVLSATDDHLTDLWTGSERYRKILMDTVADCVTRFVKDESDKDTWVVLCTVLMRFKSNENSLLSVRDEILESLKNQLTLLIHGSEINQSFKFIEGLFCRTGWLIHLSNSNYFDWFLSMLLLASVKAMDDISLFSCECSRPILKKVIESLLVESNKSEGGCNSVEDFQYFIKIKNFLMKYLTNHVHGYDQLDHLVYTARILSEVSEKHIRSFNIFKHFCNNFNFNIDRCENVTAEAENDLISKVPFLYLNCDGDAGLNEGRSLKINILVQVFYAKLIASKFDKENSNQAVEFNKEKVPPFDEGNQNYPGDDDDGWGPAFDNKYVSDSLMKMDGVSKMEIHAKDDQESCVDDEINLFNNVDNLLQCLACLSLNSHLFSIESITKMSRDLQFVLDNLMKIYFNKETVKEYIIYKINTCFDNHSDEYYDLNVTALVLYHFTKKLSSMDLLPEALTEDKRWMERICEKIGSNNSSFLILKVLACVFNSKVMLKLSDKLIQSIFDYTVETKQDINDSILNSFALLNTLLCMDESGSEIKSWMDEKSISSILLSDKCVPLDSNNITPDSNKQASDILMVYEPISRSINKWKSICDELFIDGEVFDCTIAKANIEILNFYDLIVSKFEKHQDVATSYWDEVLCFVVSQLEILSKYSQKSDANWSPVFEQLLTSHLKLILKLCKMFSSENVAEVPSRLLDEWTNLFQPSLFEYVAPMFINLVENKTLKNFDLLCDVVSYCPSSSLKHLLQPSPSQAAAAAAAAAEETKDAGEPLFELLCPLLSSQSRCVQVASYLLLKKAVPLKADYFNIHYVDDPIEVPAGPQQAQEEDESNKAMSLAIFFPSLIESFTNNSDKLKDFLGTPVKLFESLSISPTTHSMILSYFLHFELILQAYGLSPAKVTSSMLCWLTKFCAEHHMPFVCSMMQQTPPASLQHSAHENLSVPVVLCESKITPLEKEFFSSINCIHSRDDILISSNKLEEVENCSSQMEEIKDLAFRSYVRTIHSFPRIVRLWFASLDQRSTTLVDKFTSKFVSPGFISRELASVQTTNSHNNLGPNLQVKTRLASKELTATYSADDVTIELIVSFPENSPLSSLKVTLDHHRITTVKQNSSAWLLQLVKILNYKDGSLLDALAIFSKNLDRHFDGNSCMICFSLILNHQGSKILPKLQCKTCKKKFHNVCLFTWFKTSHNAACPLCRSTF